MPAAAWFGIGLAIGVVIYGVFVWRSANADARRRRRRIDSFLRTRRDIEKLPETDEDRAA